MEYSGKNAKVDNKTYGVNMDLKTFENTPPWEWPDGSDKVFLKTISDRQASESDRLLAVELAGDFVVINDELVDALLLVLGSSDESEEIRSKAAISLGPALETAFTMGFEDPGDVPITEQTYNRIKDMLRELYMDADIPKLVQRRILEAAVRSPQEWHQDAVLAAYSSDDEDWKLTAVFSMGYVRGFNDQILEALESENPYIHYEAVWAAGQWEIDAAWPHVTSLVNSEHTDKPLLLAAIDAVVNIRPRDAGVILVDLTHSDDEEIAEAASEAMVMAEGTLDIE